jgi:hypothetical protein
MDRPMVRRHTLLVAAVATLATSAAVPAHAAERWATPTGGATSGTCLAVSPCTIERSVNFAAPGDTIVAAPGEYDVTTALVGAAGITIKAADGQGAPILKGAVSLNGPTLTLSGASTLARVGLGQLAAGKTALVMREGVIERSSIVSDSGVAAELGGTGGTVVARDSVFVTRSTNNSDNAVELTGNKDIALRNLTIWAGNGAAGLECGATGAQTLVNVIVRGVAGSDIVGSDCQARHSNFRPGASPGVSAGAGNQSAAPVLGDTIVDFRPRAGSPTTNAGTEDALLGALDFDGQDRRLGGGPDIGAHESVFDHPAPAQPQPERKPEDAAPPVVPPADGPLPAPAPVAEEPAPAAPPQLGRRVVLGADTGTVKVKRPGASTFVALEDLDSLPVGTVVDARRGSVTLSTAVAGGRTQTGTFGGGQFEVRQPRTGRGMTDIVLRGGAFGACPRPRARSAAVAIAAAAKRKKVVRRLWARDKGGRFRTHGRNSVATVRGTRWVTEDRCDGTLTRVTEGAVDVRANGAKKAVRVRAGRSLLVRRAR